MARQRLSDLDVHMNRVRSRARAKDVAVGRHDPKQRYTKMKKRTPSAAPHSAGHGEGHAGK